MDHQAHGLDLTHPIFHAPNEVRFTWTEGASSKSWAGATSVRYPNGIGATCRLTSFEKEKGYWNPILVNQEGFFTDVPGLENIAEGHSEKELGSLAIARQGRWLYWAFSIDPLRLTASGQDVLVNALHYMAGKRDSLTVEYVCKPRQILAVYLALHKRTGYSRGIEEHLPGSLTPQSRPTYVPTREGCEAWLAKYLPYVLSGKTDAHRSQRYQTVFEIDEDALALGTPNAARKSLETWLALAAGDDAGPRDQARRCLQRYVHPSIAPKDGDWAGWYARYKERIVFIESTGFWWQEDPRLLEREAAAARTR